MMAMVPAEATTTSSSRELGDEWPAITSNIFMNGVKHLSKDAAIYELDCYGEGKKIWARVFGKKKVYENISMELIKHDKADER